MKLLPLSPMQQGLLFHFLRDGRGAVDVVQLVCVQREGLRENAFREAWDRIVRRHEALRTSLAWEEGRRGQQSIGEPFAAPVSFHDWRAVDAAEKEVRFSEFRRRRRLAGFDLEIAPLWAVDVIRLADDDTRCVWTLHHFVADGRSCEIVLWEVYAEYERITKGGAGELPPAVPASRFADWLGSRDEEADARFWKERLSGLEAGTRIEDAGAPEGSGRVLLDRRLTPEQTEGLRRTAARHGVTLNTLVQAAWARVLALHTGSREVVYGVIRAGRAPLLTRDDSAVGVFINTVPLRLEVAASGGVGEFLHAVRERHLELRDYEHSPLAEIQRWSGLPATAPLFDTLLIFDHHTVEGGLRERGGWDERRVEHYEDTGYPVSVYAYGNGCMLLRLAFHLEHITSARAEMLLRHFEHTLLGWLERAQDLSELPVMPVADRDRLLNGWNDTAAEVGPASRIEEAFVTAVLERPDEIAVVAGEARLTYRELHARVAGFAHALRETGVESGDRVAICLDRTLDLPVALLGVLAAGAAYVPLDPNYPAERLGFILEDSGARLVITRRPLVARLPPETRTFLVETHGASAAELPPHTGGVDDPAYIVHTSGSTGRPKGVVVEHRSVHNFFAGMDRVLGREHSTWLALTSPSFDISVLELLWTLTRGCRVVVFSDEAMPANTPLGFGLFYFASGGHDSDRGAYRLLLEGARFADERGFDAVWTPERHFHAFGGLYPNPAVTGAAIAATTTRVQIRSGSVVLPLHHPVRVAEEWAVVDRLSNGRVGVSMASGWHPNDFVLAPERYANRRTELFEAIETVRRLWRGESVSFPGPTGELVEIRTMPRPVQPELPVWVTTSGTRETFERAGRAGVHVLTHLLGQSIDDVAANIAAYRRARADAGFDPAEGRVALMVHTFVGADDDSVREIVRGPMTSYLASAVDLVKNFADTWTAVSRRAPTAANADRNVLKDLSEEDRRSLLDFAFERYYETSGLLGSVEKCAKLAADIRAAGVDEIACLIDFGVPADLVLEHLEHLDHLRRLVNAEPVQVRGAGLGEVLEREGVTHVQCTPSRARLILADPQARAGLRRLDTLLLGGEALPRDLAVELREATDARLLNMYGPTEATVWATFHEVDAAEPGDVVAIGKPLANTRCYVVDATGMPVPEGVAGELWIGGDNVARGYHDRPELTAERFLPDPFADGGRVYRTGDLVRRRADGALEFLGRLDDQVKVRGHRIEVGEIECVLAEHPAVRQAVVVARGDAVAGIRLVGYVVPENGRREDLMVELRGWLAKRLPPIMVPSALLAVDTMPLTPNGKLDRRALPEPGSVGPDGVRSVPAGRLEGEIAAVWKEVLGLDSVGASDNFFDLGGHSLLTIQVQRRLRERLGRDIPITDLFRFPTVRALADHLEGGDATTRGADVGRSRAEMRRHARSRRSSPAGS